MERTWEVLCIQDVGVVMAKLISPELSVAALQLLVKVFGVEILLQLQFPRVERVPGGGVFSSFTSSKGRHFSVTALASQCLGSSILL